MDYPWAEEFGKLARRHRIALSVHAPIAGFMGHVERDKKHGMAVGMLDHSAGIAKAAGAEPVVFHPGFLLGRTRKRRARLGRRAARRPARSGSRARTAASRSASRSWAASASSAALDDVLAISARSSAGCGPCIDFAHLHAVTDGAFTTVEGVPRRPRGREHASSRAARRSTSTSPTSPTRTGTRRSTCPTARARCGPSRSAKALARFARPATVITESPDEESTSGDSCRALRRCGEALRDAPPKAVASSSRPRSRRN